MEPDKSEETSLSNGFKSNEINRPYKIVIVWKNVIIFLYVHIAALYAIFLLNTAMFSTIIWALLLHKASILGITAGAHRLWSHRSYEANWNLQLVLLIFNTIAYQNDAYEWARDHRLHHRYSDTDADPHNSSRGFFFSHIGWLLMRKHPLVLEKGKETEMSDLKANPLVMFQRRHYWILMPLLAFIIPTVIPVYLWNETWSNSWHVAGMLRWCLSLHCVWVINSVAHLWGNKPYDKNIEPRDNTWATLCNLGEGWHNYHHVFPWDYRTAEFISTLNITTIFINLMAKIGWAYNLKVATPKCVEQRKERTGIRELSY